ncbi:MAG: multiheme c-type cytochrome [Campylobacterota bacterium]|nr:multiheme c-type cytochrome [Campylobacterota bacterium]
MRQYFLLLFFLCFSSYLQAAESVALTQQYSDSSKCKSCHHQIIDQWKHSWHAKSHYKNDEYFRKTVDYVGRKSRKSANAIKIECAGCHNPRISVTKTGMDYELQVAMKLDKNSKVNKALASDTLSEGINCVVCHNIDKIHTDLDDSKRGVNRVSWMPQGTMVGPFENAFSPYHKTEQRDFFNDKADTLCFVCHANDRSVAGLEFTNMQKEYKKSKKMCVDCHMSPRIDGIASTLRIKDGKQVKRKVRKHGFRGAHTKSMWEGALDLKAEAKDGKLIITLKNSNPHNIPSGFGSRELIIDVEFKSVGEVVKRQSMSLTRHYTSKRDKPTIPHLAVKQSADVSIPANGSKSVSFPLQEAADSATINLSYRLVNDEVRNLLKLKEAIWSEKMPINILKMKF